MQKASHHAPLRYALLRHECPADYRDGPHWDLMLERPGVKQEHRLATWSLLALPEPWADLLGLSEAASRTPAPATGLPDHRAKYLAYEGLVGGGRGEVSRCAGGELRWLEDAADRVAVGLLDGVLAGSLELRRHAEARWELSVASLVE